MKKCSLITKSWFFFLITFAGCVFSDTSKTYTSITPDFQSGSINALHHRFPANNELTGSFVKSYKDVFTEHGITTNSAVSYASHWHHSLKENIGEWDITLFDKNPTENQAWLWYQSKVTLGLALGVLVVIGLLPTRISKWDKSNLHPFKRWWDNVSRGPVVDDDKWYINYIGHPYFGGVYYVSARSSGYNPWNSFVYSLLMSTFLYEYGIEAIFERPSIQDLIVTPVVGSIYGEWAFRKKAAIIQDDGRAMGSKTIGTVALLLLDPVGQVSQWIKGDKGHSAIQNLSIQAGLVSTFPTYQQQPGQFTPRHFGINVHFDF